SRFFPSLRDHLLDPIPGACSGLRRPTGAAAGRSGRPPARVSRVTSLADARPAAVPTVSAAARARATVGAYVALTKPRIIELLLVTTVPTMVLAARGWPGWVLTAATLAGGSLAAGSANALNCWGG